MPDVYKSYEDLFTENQRLKSVQPVGQKATIYIGAIISLAILDVGFVLGISYLRPSTDNAGLILGVNGVMVPIITALLAAAVQQVHVAVNSRLSQLLELTADASRAKGALIERDKVLAESAVANAETVPQRLPIVTAPVVVIPAPPVTPRTRDGRSGDSPDTLVDWPTR